MVQRMKRVGGVEIIVAAALVAAIVFNAGFLHVVHGGKVYRWPGIQICIKLEWTLRNTFMNTDDYVGQQERVAQLDANAVRALVRCGVVRIPPAPAPTPAPPSPEFEPEPGAQSYTILTSRGSWRPTS
jgi:hypothetical protein